jgi:hypothetical protein
VSTNDREAIREWIAERLADIEQEGSLAALAVVHYDGQGRENDVHKMLPTTKNWGDPDRMADIFDGIATRHARGIPGAQQFQMTAHYGSSAKPLKFLPFMRSGALSFGPMPGGGLGTEPATQVGQTQQGMRMGEMVVQGMIGWARPVFEAGQQMIQYQGAQIVRLSEENRELFIALRDQLAETIKLAHDRRMAEMQFIRSTEERRRVFKLLPALVNATTGREIFPLSAEDTALIDTLCANVSEEEIKFLSSMIGQKNPELSGLIIQRFVKGQEKQLAEQEEIARLSREVIGVDPEEDAAGNATAIVRKANGGNGSNGSGGGGSTNGVTPSTAAVAAGGGARRQERQGPQPAASQVIEVVQRVVDATTGADTKLLDDLFATVPAAQIDMLASTLGAASPDLARRIKERASKTADPTP